MGFIKGNKKSNPLDCVELFIRMSVSLLYDSWDSFKE